MPTKYVLKTDLVVGLAISRNFLILANASVEFSIKLQLTGKSRLISKFMAVVRF